MHWFGTLVGVREEAVLTLLFVHWFGNLVGVAEEAEPLLEASVLVGMLITRTNKNFQLRKRQHKNLLQQC